MRRKSYRSSMPFDNKGPYGNPSISPTTDKSIQPFNNVTTIQDILDNRKKIEDVYPHAGGDWSPGEDVDKSYKEKGDDYKRQEKDELILDFLMEPREKSLQKWKVRVPGGTRTFISFELAKEYTRKNNIPFTYITRIAQNNFGEEKNRVLLISESINKTFMVESIDTVRGVRETGSGFCVFPGYFLTCAHVIKRYNKNEISNKVFFENTIISMINDGKKYKGVLIAVDAKMDLALLRCEIDVDYMKIGGPIDVGENIIVIGSPHGYENDVSTGIVSSLDRKLYFYNGAPEYMFMDLSIYPGSSGGPVIKESTGNVVGIVTMIVDGSHGYGLNAALPYRYMNDFCKNNIKGFSFSE